MKRRTLLAAAPLAAIVLAARAARADNETAAWAALQGGGCAILLRHAQTEPGIGDPPGFRLDECSTQRNLSAAGRAQAQRFGAALRARGVRIDEVRSSRWCRCLDTARLAFPALAVQPFAPLDSFFEDRRTAAQQTAAVRRYLADLGPRNALLVTHQVNISALTGQFAAMGEAVVVRPAAADAAPVVGRLRVD
ncbi:MAG: histidine phosphatase family protein [Burkholderiaceae bacterium]|nr:histidine phosphatase family protein [Burkholderiaceae bacterium]